MPHDAALVRRRKARGPGLLRLLAYAGVLEVLAWSYQGAGIKPVELARDSGNILTLLREFVPPDFSQWRDYVGEMVLTVQIAIWGTGLAVLCAVPCGLLCAGNVAPWWVARPVRRMMDVCRSINELVFAMLFVVAVGLGPFAGVLALWVHTTGILAKLFTGARGIEEIVYGVIPQVMPLWVSFSLYRFESNVRSASVIGLVGAGGIGQMLWEIIRAFQFQQACAIMLVIVAAVTLIDAASQQLRRAFI